jgi:hypothetical protein
MNIIALHWLHGLPIDTGRTFAVHVLTVLTFLEYMSIADVCAWDVLAFGAIEPLDAH